MPSSMNSLYILLIFLSLFQTRETAKAIKFQSKQRNQALNKTADLELTAQDKQQCLLLCQHTELCQALNVEKVSEFQYICYLFYYASLLSLTRNDFITKPNTQYFYIKLAGCQDFGTDGQSGAYFLTQLEHEFWAWCSVDDDGIWTVIMRHTDDGITFDKSWKEFKEGFGNLSATHWVGNEYIHALTRYNDMEAKVEIIDNNDVEYVGKYSQFMVASEQEKYQLTVSGFQTSSNTFHDELGYFNGLQFSTYDQDNDVHPSNCPQIFGNNGWWFKACHIGFMTGKYLEEYNQGNTWGTLLVKHSVLKVRRK